MADIKKELRSFIDGRKKEKENEENERRRRLDDDRSAILQGIGADLSEALRPVLEMLPESARISEEQIRNALTEAISINLPEVDTGSIANAVREAVSGIEIPAPVVNVSVPEMKVPQMPEICIPETVFPSQMSVGLENFTNKNPMPVMLMDAAGKPLQFSIPAGTTGGKADFLTVKGIQNTIGIVSINPDGTPAGAGSVASSVSVSDIFGTTGANVVNPDGRIKVELPTGSSGLTDTELRASAVPVSQVSGASWSISATDIFATTSTSTVVNPDNRVRVELPNTTITGITNTVATANVDSTGVQYSGSNPMPVYLVLGSGNSTFSVGPVAGDVADDGSAPVQIGGIARTANPTAVSANDVVKSTFDDLGRQIVRPVQVRDLTVTAYVSVTSGTETTLLAASAGSFHDLIMLVGSNNSDAAVSVDIRAVTAGNIIHTLRIPANGTAGFSPTIPWPQDATGNNWTVDGPDETGRTLTFSALFSREV